MTLSEETEWVEDHDGKTWCAYRNSMGATRVDVLVMDFITIAAVCKYLQFNCTQEVLTHADSQGTDTGRKSPRVIEGPRVSGLDIPNPKDSANIEDGNEKGS